MQIATKLIMQPRRSVSLDCLAPIWKLSIKTSGTATAYPPQELFLVGKSITIQATE
jgi:hypothetical protein